MEHFHTTLDQDGFSKSLVKAEFKALFQGSQYNIFWAILKKDVDKCVFKKEKKIPDSAEGSEPWSGTWLTQQLW